MIGIYKITNPNNKIYIGQSVCIENRYIQYKNYIGNNSSIGIKLYLSFQKYGFENHKFEIIEECTLEQLNEREIYWMNCYNVLGKNGLNIKEGGSKGKHNEETKKKMSITHSNKLTNPDILEKRLINCKQSSTNETQYKKILNTNWEERNKKLKKPKKHYKIIYQYDLDNVLIRTYCNIKEILPIFSNPKPQNLYACLKGKYKTWMGYKWKGSY